MSDTQAAGGLEDSVLEPAAAAQDDGAAGADAGEAADGGEARVEDVAAAPLESDLEQLAAKAAERDEYLALAQRTQADFENYRKRIAREVDAASARGIGKLARELLPALDNLERALAAASSEANADVALIEGLRLVARELHAALERVGIERYGEVGELFDPSQHEAVAQQPCDGVQSGSIVEIYQAGYRLGVTVIRPARVLVAA